VQVRLAKKDSQLAGSGPKEQAALRMQGLPFKATDEDIEEFFSGFNMIAGSVKY
jgi:RNA recognition motif-containing protein